MLYGGVLPATSPVDTYVKVYLPRPGGAPEIISIKIPAGQFSAGQNVNSPNSGPASLWNTPNTYILSAVERANITGSVVTSNT